MSIAGFSAPIQRTLRGRGQYSNSSITYYHISPYYQTTIQSLTITLPGNANGIKARVSPRMLRIDDSRALSAELASHPEARLEIQDISGRHQQMVASDALQRLQSVHGIRMIRLDLPDRTLSGMILLP